MVSAAVSNEKSATDTAYPLRVYIAHLCKLAFNFLKNELSRRADVNIRPISPA